jgi:hypothetical protein
LWVKTHSSFAIEKSEAKAVLIFLIALALCASLWLNLAGLVDDDVINCVWKFGYNAGVKTTCSIAIEKSEAKAICFLMVVG